MSEPKLSRRVAEAVVEAMKGHAHVLLVKGGTEPLVREIDVLVQSRLSGVSGGLVQRQVVGEVTSTFGDEAIDEAVEQLVDAIAKQLMESDHVEDVFAEDHVMRRDIFRAVRDAMLAMPEDGEEEVPAPISVRLDTLGYVASTVARRADAATLRDALERAAAAANGELASYDAASRQATFTTTTRDPDARLEIEEAVAEELEDLVHEGVVHLPSVERSVELPAPIAARGKKAALACIEAAAARTLRASGYTADWELEDGRVRLTLTPHSEADARKVDDRVASFSRELATLEVDGGPPPPAPAPPPKEPPEEPIPAQPPIKAARQKTAAREGAAGVAEKKKAPARAKRTPSKRPSAPAPAPKTTRRPASSKPAASAETVRTRKAASGKPAAKSTKRTVKRTSVTARPSAKRKKS